MHGVCEDLGFQYAKSDSAHMDDFPQKKIRKRLSNSMFSFFLSIKPVRKKIHQEFIPGMVAPYKKVLKKL
jgi:hypothetical protein